MTGWRLLLRMAWRDARRARGRSLLVLAMIALPVLAVTAADIAYQTSEISGAEGLDRRLGTADAALSVLPGQIRVVQGFDPDQLGPVEYDDSTAVPALADISRALDRPVSGIERRAAAVRFVTDEGLGDAEVTEIDLGEPLTAGLFELTSGRLPARADEAVVNADLAARGPSVGETLELADGRSLSVVGIAESTEFRGFPVAVAPPGAFGLEEAGSSLDYLVGGGAVSWDDVRALNDIGVLVLSREVLTNPPPASELPEEIRAFDLPVDRGTVAVLALVVSMALLEVVLLAGPAFAVTARRQSRTIALMAASGGTPAQARRLVLATGIVLGTLAALAGVVVGIVVGWAILPVLQQFSISLFGPLEVPWLHLLGVAGFGVLSAVLAAVVPAWTASRQDVVAVLAGRRGDRKASLRSPVVGLLLLGVGIAAAVYGATSTSGETFIAMAALIAVLGMILLVPLVLVGLAKVSGRLPLAVRYAVRDAARQRTRTVPAVAAVAATVAGVVTLGIAGSSDQAEAEASYLPSLTVGVGAVSIGEPGTNVAPYRTAIADILPDATVTDVRSVSNVDPEGAQSYDLVRVADPSRVMDVIPLTFGGGLGDLLVSDTVLPPGLLGVSDDQRVAAENALAGGGMVAFTNAAIEADDAILLVEEFDFDTGELLSTRSVAVPALWVVRPGGLLGPQAVISSAVADEVGLAVATTHLVVSGAAIDAEQEADLTERIAALSPIDSFYLERGYQADETWLIVLLVLGGLGAVLMLGGTLTATFLALADARPDLATLSAVGASPRTRRGVAGAFALVVGVVGATLGALVGFIPGVAITFPLTGQSWQQEANPALPSHFLDVPWLLIGSLVIVLPLLTALLVSLAARARLPLVARLD